MKLRDRDTAPLLLTTPEVCEILRISSETFRQLRMNAEFPIQQAPFGRGLYPSKKVYDYIDQISGVSGEEDETKTDALIAGRLANANQSSIPHI